MHSAVSGVPRRLSLVTAVGPGVALVAVAPAREGFEGMAPGALPAPWITGSTGGGTPLWRVEEMADAPEGKRVLVPKGQARFPYAVQAAVSLRDA